MKKIIQYVFIAILIASLIPFYTNASGEKEKESADDLSKVRQATEIALEKNKKTYLKVMTILTLLKIQF